MKNVRLTSLLPVLVAFGFLPLTNAADPAPRLVWHADTQRLDADINSLPLTVVMKDLHEATGAEIELPGGLDRTVSVKFTDLPLGDALNRMLTGLNYYGSFVDGVYQLRILDPNGNGPAVAIRSPSGSSRPPGSVRPPGSGFVGGLPYVQPGANPQKGDKNKTPDMERAMKDAEREVMKEALKASGIDPKDFKKPDSSGQGGGGGKPSKKPKSR